MRATKMISVSRFMRVFHALTQFWLRPEHGAMIAAPGCKRALLGAGFAAAANGRNDWRTAAGCYPVERQLRAAGDGGPRSQISTLSEIASASSSSTPR